MTNKISDKYTVDLDKLSSDSEILNNIRNDGMNRFLNIGLPTARKGNEKWKYTNIAPIAGIDFELPVHKDQNDLDEIIKNQEEIMKFTEDRTFSSQMDLDYLKKQIQDS